MITSCNRTQFRRLVGLAISCGCLVFLLPSCATNPGVSHEQPDIDKLPAVAKQAPTVYQESIERMHRVAFETMLSMNCTIAVESPAYVKGRLPTGEFVEIILKPVREKETHLWVNTARTFVGGAWQANRNREVLNVINRQLDRDRMLNP
jgi:hypothetical protein